MASVDYQAIFKRLYYHLYSNSNSSRAEKLLDDVTKLLLYSYAISASGEPVTFSAAEIETYLSSKYAGTAFDVAPFALDDGIIATIMPELLTLDLQHAPAHIVGEAVQSMIGPRIRGDKGQFFTPESLVRCIVDVVDICPGSTVIDPACGTGGFLSAARESTEISGKPSTFVGMDKDRDMANLAFAVMQIEAGDDSDIRCCNSLEFFMPDNPLSKYVGKADVVITNPPFGAKIGITDKTILSNYEFGHVWTSPRGSGEWKRTAGIARKQDPQVLFIELCVKLLADGGTLGIVLPEGIFYGKSFGYIWQYLEAHGEIIALIDCTRNTFQPSTDTKTNVLIYRKGKAASCGVVWFSQAVTCGHDRRGRTQSQAGEPLPDDFIQIGRTWRRKEDPDTPWVVDTPENGLYVPRYYVNRSAKKQPEGDFVTLGELIDSGCLSIRSGHEVGSEAYGTGEIPYVRTSDINNFEISSDPTNSVSEEVYARFNRQENLQPGDILFIADGRYRIGKTAMITEHNAKCVVQSHIDILTLSANAPLTPYELLYLINTQYVQSQIGNLVFISSTLGTIGSRIRELRIPIPMRDEQWNATINRFENLLKGRASMLAELEAYEQATEG